MDINKFLRDLKSYGIANEIPNISEVNAKFLRDLIQISGTKNMLEIGTANGYSAINFAIELQKVSGKLTTIEFSKLSYDIAVKNFQDAQVSEIIQALCGNALDIIPTLNEVYDFVFIDGMKRRTKDFLELTRNKVKPGGIIIVDDVIKFRHKMVGFFEYMEQNNIKYNILPIDIDDGVVMIVK